MWDRLTFLQKGLVLISVPLLFDAAFFGLLADMLQENTRATASAIHTKELLLQTAAVSRNLRELGTTFRSAVLTADPERSRVRQQWLLWAGLGSSLVITLLLLFVFSRSLGGRLAVVAHNAQRLAEGKPLTPPVRGSDEVAQLDRAFRYMASEVEQA